MYLNIGCHLWRLKKRFFQKNESIPLGLLALGEVSGVGVSSLGRVKEAVKQWGEGASHLMHPLNALWVLPVYPVFEDKVKRVT